MPRKRQTSRKTESWKPAPLPSSFMLLAILGVIISAFYVFPLSYNWGVAFLILFTLMFVASIISMVEGPIEVEWEMERRHL